jgi:hypothetical protein
MSPIADNSGWSLLDRGATLSGSGRLEVLDRDECRRQSPQPWPEGRRALVVQLPLTTVTGRRVHPA